MPQWTRSGGVSLPKVGLRREPVGLALWGHMFCAASLLHGKSDNGKGHGEVRSERTDTSSFRSAPTAYEGFQVEALSPIRLWIA